MALWQCGMGGVFYADLWGWVIPCEFSEVVTIPLGEFLASIGGLYFLGCTWITLGPRASSAPHATSASVLPRTAANA
eukprot:1182977-Prymnesium_polylepis.1